MRQPEIRLFAGYFLAHVRLPTTAPFKLLDVGCGTGSALAEIRKRYPRAVLQGCDILEHVVELAAAINSDAGSFFASDILSLRGNFDCIYVSNVLEHIQEWKDCLDHLCALSPQVVVMVPFKEDLSFQKPSGLERVDHVTSFNERSMAAYATAGYRVEQRVIVRFPNQPVTVSSGRGDNRKSEHLDTKPASQIVRFTQVPQFALKFPCCSDLRAQ